nr:MAG TPA: minor tail protein [Caudoviricetes sp.]
MLDSMMKVSLTLVAFDKMSKVIRDAVNTSNSEFDKMQNKIKNLSSDLEKVGKAATIVGGSLMAFSAANLKLAADFSAGMTNVSTLIDTNVENFDAMKEEVLQIAKRTPVALDGLTSALYDIRSAGISANMQFGVLEKSAQLGLTGLGSTSEAVDLVTSSLNAFNLKGKEAEKLYDTIFKTVKFGKTTISGIAQGFGSVAGTVAASNIKLDDYLAAVAALTTTGQPAAQAHHQLKAAIAGMLRETDDSKKVFNTLGVKSFKELIQKSGGMVNAFKAITNCVGGNESAILSLFGSTMAYNAVLGLTTKQNKAYVETLNSMRYGTSLIDEGYQKQYNTEHAMMQRLKNMSQVIGIQLGEALAPAFGKVLDFGESTLNMLDKMSPQMKSFVAISIAGLGILATSFGIACLMGSKLLKFYGGFLSRARELTPVLVQNSASILESMGLKTTAQNLTLGYNLKGGANIGSGLFSDIKRIDNNLRKGIVTGFKEFPSNVSKSAIALKDWTVTSVKAIPTNFVNGLKAFKTGFLNIPNLIKNAVIAFRTFSITLLTSPLGWIAVAIGVVALVIYKYWKPIAGFFKGLWQGLVEGLKPLMPLFKQIGTAIEPILKPIKAVFNWFKKLIQPVEDTGGKAEAMGVRVGKAIAGIIVKLTELVAKAFECGRKITSMLAEGIMSGLAKVKNCIVKVAQVIRDHLPHSPAKTGPLKDLNKVKIVETIASTIKPMPLKNAMTKTLSFMTNGTLNVSKGKIGTSSGASFVVQYNPTITISGTESKEEFVKLLKRHKDEVVNIMKREFERKERLAY